ncbi:MAG: hypothetical protein FWG41_05115 [Methanomassiliicoccaceae archaeon]|nr:hypothetical protein [Methanomassiliicoccaceae archaeon]
MGIGQEVLNVPFGAMVYQVASAIATSQTSLDKSSVEILKVMGDVENNPVSLPILKEDGTEGSIKTSMIGAGFQPAFYQFTDAIIEVKMAISMSYDNEYSSGYQHDYESKYESKNKKYNYASASTTTINANYTSKYSFNEEASSTLRVRLVPLPPNPIMQRLIELRAQRQQLQFELQIKKAELEMQKEMEKVANTTV